MFFLSSCYTVGTRTLSKDYIKIENSKDVDLYIKCMNNFKLNNEDLTIDSNDIIKFKNVKFDSIWYNPKHWFPLINCDINNKHCQYSWFLKTIDDSTIYDLMLLDFGLSIRSIDILHNGKYHSYYREDLNFKNRALIRKSKKRFETEILPRLKPYFKEYLN